MRQEAMDFDAHLKRQKAHSEKMETVSYKAWRADADNKEKQTEFHAWCDKTREIQKRIEANEPYVAEKWYMTEYLHSDAHAYEVVEVYGWNRMDVRKLKATEKPEAREARLASFVPGGFCGHFDNELQEWSFESDESNPVLSVRRHSDGRFYRPNTRTCPFVPHSEPYERYDFNF